MNRYGRIAVLASMVAVGFAFQADTAVAQQKPLRDQLVGTWRLVSNDNVAPSGEKRRLFGANPKGLTIFDASGWYTQIQINPDRPRFQGKTRLDGTAEENKAVVHATAVHFGTWSVDEARRTLTVRQDVNIFPNDDGLVSTRSITLTGDTLKSINQNPSSGGTSEIVWERIK